MTKKRKEKEDQREIFLSCQDLIDKRKELWSDSNNIEQDNEYVLAIAEKLVEESGQGAALREEISRYPEYLIEMCFVVVDKNQVTMPFFINEVQGLLLNEINQAIDEYREGKRNHLKFLILKGRQQGQRLCINVVNVLQTVWLLSC